MGATRVITSFTLFLVINRSVNIADLFALINRTRITCTRLIWPCSTIVALLVPHLPQPLTSLPVLHLHTPRTSWHGKYIYFIEISPWNCGLRTQGERKREARRDTQVLKKAFLTLIPQYCFNLPSMVIDDNRLSDSCWNSEMREIELWGTGNLEVVFCFFVFLFFVFCLSISI